MLVFNLISFITGIFVYGNNITSEISGNEIKNCIFL